MDFLALILGAVLSGGFIVEYGKQPLDIPLVEQVSTQEIQQPLFEGWASWYDYKLGNQRWSKNHDTCALRIYERYKKYKVCVDDRCVVCYHNDYGPQRQDRVVDLSSHAFKQLAPLSRGVVKVQIYKLD